MRGDLVRYLEFIESSGAQYIDTGISVDPTYRVEAEFCVSGATSNWDTLFGCRSGSNARFTARFKNNTSGVLDFQRSKAATSAYQSWSSSLQKTRDCLFRWHSVAIDGADVLVDGTAAHSFDAAASADAFPYRLYLFANNDAGSPGDYGYLRLRRCEIRDGNGDLVRSFLPAEDGNGAGGLYDTVTQTFFPNAGSGSFYKGPVLSWGDAGKKQFLSGLAIGRQLKGWATLHRAIPTRIEVLTPPTLREYADGAALDFTGLEVVLRKADGGRYTDANYPDGLIPMSELSFPVTHAHFDGTGGQGAGEFYVGDTLACRSLYCEERTMSDADYQAGNRHSPLAKLFREGRVYGEWFAFWDHAPFKVAYRGNGSFLTAAAGDGQGSVRGETNNIGVQGYRTFPSYSVTPKFTYDGKEVFYFDLHEYRNYLYEPYLEPSDIVDSGAAAWAMIFGGLGEKQSVPVEWTAPLTKFPALPTMRDAVSVFVHETT